IRTTKAIRTQNFIATVLRNKGTYLISKRTHVICRYYDWTLCIFQALCDVRQTCCICRVQHVPTFCILAITCQQCKGWCGPDVSSNTPVTLQQFGSSNDFTQNRAGTHQLYTVLRRLLGLLQQVQTFDDAFFLTWLDTWVAVVLVHQGDVVEHVFLLSDHAAQTVMNNDSNFMGKCRIVRNAVRNRRCQYVAMTIFMLQAFAVQCRTTSSTAQQEATCAHVARCPCQIANTLQTEHRVVSVERDHDAIVGRVGGCRSNP